MSEKKFLIGMIHLPPLPGAPFYKGENFANILDYAIKEGKKLEHADFSAVMVENIGDFPYEKNPEHPYLVAAMSVIARELVKELSIPVGVNVLRNAACSSLSIAHFTGAKFIRVNALVETISTDSGIIEPAAPALLRLKALLHSKVKIFADVRVKHAAPLGERDIADVMHDCAARGGADAIIVSGPRTGVPPTEDWIKKTASFSLKPVLIGSGISLNNVDLLKYTKGVIIGTAIKENNITLNPISQEKADKFVSAVKSRWSVAHEFEEIAN